MSKILGLDLGTNSIGWAIIDQNKSIENYGIKAFPTFNDKPVVENKMDLRDKLFWFKNRKKLLSFMCLTGLLFLMAILLKAQWQFWLNLGIGGLFITLNETKE